METDTEYHICNWFYDLVLKNTFKKKDNEELMNKLKASF